MPVCQLPLSAFSKARLGYQCFSGEVNQFAINYFNGGQVVTMVNLANDQFAGYFFNLCFVTAILPFMVELLVAGIDLGGRLPGG